MLHHRQDDTCKGNNQVLHSQSIKKEAIKYMLTVIDHPLIKHKISIMRNKDTSTYIFIFTCKRSI